MKIKSLCIALAALLLSCQSGFGQGGPYLVDHLNPKAWPNPSYSFVGERARTSSRTELGQKQKYYYVYYNPNKQSATIEGGWISPTQHKAYIKWEDPADGLDNYFYYYPDIDSYDAIFDAIAFNTLDPITFQNFNGPYCQIADNPFYVGKVSGTFWISFSGLLRPMGGIFSQSQINKIKDANKSRPGHNSTMKSDLRATLVTEFLNVHPEVDPSEIPVDPIDVALSDSNAAVCHILPRIAPEGNGCGRNAMRNALLVSKDHKADIEERGYPSQGFIAYCEWLASKYNKSLPLPTPPQPLTYQILRDLSQLSRMEVEYLDEDETKAFLDYANKSKQR